MNIKPLSKTIVTEIKSTLVDITTRSKITKAAGAAAIGTGNFFNGDINLFPDRPYIIENIQTTLTIICFEPITLSVMAANSTESMIFTINNQFTFNGACPYKIKLSTRNTNGTRIQVAYN